MNRSLFIAFLLVIFCFFSYNLWSQSCTTTANFGFTRCPAPLQHTRENYFDFLDKVDDHNHTGGTQGVQLTDSALSSLVTVPKGGTGIASGTSGGVPYFSGSTTIASSGALTANLPVIGGGAGSAPSVGTRSGNTTQYVTTTGAQTSGRCVEIDLNGNHVAASDPCGTGTGGGSGTANYEEGFTAQTSVTMTDAEHGFGHAKLLVACYDNSSPKVQIIPDSVDINTSTFAVTVTFSEATTGSCVVNGSGGGGGGGGSAIVLDIDDDGANESAGVTELATINTPEDVVTEPTADKMLIDFSKLWTESLTADKWDPVLDVGCNKAMVDSSPDYIGLHFSGTTSECATTQFTLPRGFENGGTTWDIMYHWTAQSGSGAIVMQFQVGCLGDNEAISVGNAAQQADTLIGANQNLQSGLFTQTHGGVGGELCLMRMCRLPGDAGDTLNNIDAIVRAVRLSR